MYRIKLKNLLLALISTAVLCLGTSAHAAFEFLLDDFDTDLAEIESGTTDGSSTTGASQAIPNPGDTTTTGMDRVVTVTRDSGTNSSGHTSVSISDSLYRHSQDNDVAGSSEAEWNFDSTDLTTLTVDKLVAKTDADLAGGFLSLLLEDGGGNSHQESGAIAVGDGNFVMFDLPDYTAGGVDLSDIVRAIMTVDGTGVENFDADIDFVSSEIPEPGTVFLFGLGLAAVGARRLRSVARA